MSYSFEINDRVVANRDGFGFYKGNQGVIKETQYIDSDLYLFVQLYGKEYTIGPSADSYWDPLFTCDDDLLSILREDGLRLMDIEEQTPQLCMAAVQQNGLALEYVKNQTREICLTALQQNGFAIAYVDKEIGKEIFTHEKDPD